MWIQTSSIRFSSSIPLFAIAMAGSIGFPDCERDCGFEECPGRARASGRSRSSSSPEVKGEEMGSLMSIVWTYRCFCGEGGEEGRGEEGRRGGGG